MIKLPIRVKAAHPAAALHRASRVDYGTVYTVAHGVRVKSVGLVHVDSMLRLIKYFENWETDGSNTHPESEESEMPVPSEEKPCIERALEATDREYSTSATSSYPMRQPSDESRKSTKSQSGCHPFRTLITAPLLERRQSSPTVRRSASLPPPNKPPSPV